MKLGVLTNLYGNKSLEEVLQILNKLDISMAEIGCGGYPGKAHCDPEILLNDSTELQKFIDTFQKYNIEISALSCHGNPVNPNKEAAQKDDHDFRNAVLLAEKLGIDTVITFSGCPGDYENAKYPNWVTCPWPDEYGKILDYQWNNVLIPYWKDTVQFANAHHVTKIALEMHPGFCVYNPETLLKLRNAVGPTIGANFDPSHLIWQGVDPVAAIRSLEGAIYHVHAKDTKIDTYNTSKNGVLDTKHYSDEIHRSWIFRAVGFGNSLQYWRDMISNLRLCGYDKVLSIEHEDSLMSIDEGLQKAVDFLKDVNMNDPQPSTISWA